MYIDNVLMVYIDNVLIMYIDNVLIMYIDNVLIMYILLIMYIVLIMYIDNVPNMTSLNQHILNKEGWSLNLLLSLYIATSTYYTNSDCFILVIFC